MDDRAPQSFAFEEIDERLQLLPLAARRALDHAGYKLSLVSWLTLPIASRVELAIAGSSDRVDANRVETLVASASPSPPRMAVLPDPPADQVPSELAEKLGPDRPLPSDRWSRLTPLERYALSKTASSRSDPSGERLGRAYREIVLGAARSAANEPPRAPHWNEQGEARMVDVAAKPPTVRTAVASARVHVSAEAKTAIENGTVPKGDVFSVARIAGIQAAKRTDELIPLCHAIAVTGIEIAFDLDRGANAIEVTSTVRAFDRTGVEMEALVAASVAALTLYDMLKSIDRGIEITDLSLVEKTGGRSGTWRRGPNS